MAVTSIRGIPLRTLSQRHAARHGPDGGRTFTATIRAWLVASFSLTTIFILAIDWLGISGMDRIRRLEAETTLVRAGVQAQRQQSMQDMADGFERLVGGIVDSIGRTASELRTTAQAMSGTASETARRSTVAALFEELASSVQEIGRQMQGSAELGVAEETGAAAQVLASASDLSRQSAHLGREVERFLAGVRAA